VRILSVGAGAVGGTAAARLRRSGVDLAVFDTNAEHVAKLRDPGLVMGGLEDAVPVPLDASTSVPSGVFDVIFLAVRSSATAVALAQLETAIGPATDVVSLQNGLNEDAIAAVVGAERTIGCVVGFGATWLEPGHVELDAMGDLVIGRLDGSSDARLDAVREVLSAAFPTSVTDNILGALWA
jgi:2-dehydropantoate 2-reductase